VQRVADGSSTAAKAARRVGKRSIRAAERRRFGGFLASCPPGELTERSPALRIAAGILRHRTVGVGSRDFSCSGKRAAAG
jgi:hypothetical protein